MKYLFTLMLLFMSPIKGYSQYDQNYVKFDYKQFNGNPMGIIKLNMKNERVKVKYFASKDLSGRPIMDRFNDWALNKKLILVSSGTYYFYPTKLKKDKNTALPVGICIDNGKIINKLIESRLDGLVMVYTSGKITVDNLKEKKISLKQIDGSSINLDLSDSFDRNLFYNWASSVKATVFQTHLFAHNNKLLIGENANNFKDYRRFLAVGRNANGEYVQYILNLPFNSTILEGSSLSINYLRKFENIIDISFLINLDTGAQNYLTTFHPKSGEPILNSNFSGTKELKDAINLIAYYFE